MLFFTESSCSKCFSWRPQPNLMFFAVTFAVVLLQLQPKQSCIANVPLSHDVNLLSVLLHIGCVVCIDLCVYVAQAPSHPPDQEHPRPSFCAHLWARTIFDVWCLALCITPVLILVVVVALQSSRSKLGANSTTSPRTPRSSKGLLLEEMYL